MTSEWIAEILREYWILAQSQHKQMKEQNQQKNDLQNYDQQQDSWRIAQNDKPQKHQFTKITNQHKRTWPTNENCLNYILTLKNFCFQIPLSRW